MLYIIFYVINQQFFFLFSFFFSYIFASAGSLSPLIKITLFRSMIENKLNQIVFKETFDMFYVRHDMKICLFSIYDLCLHWIYLK